MKNFLITSVLVFVGIISFGVGAQAEEVVKSKPSIILLGSNPTVVVAGEPIPNLAARVIDVDGSNITNRLVVSSEAVDPENGVYVLTYMATNAEGVEAEPIVRSVQFLGQGGSYSSSIADDTPVQSVEPKPVVLIDRSPVLAIDASQIDITAPLAPISETEEGDEDASSKSSISAAKVAALALATIPTTTSDALTGAFLFLLVLALIYIGSNIVVNSQELVQNEKEIRKLKIFYFMIGNALALLLVILFEVFHLLIPLIITFIALGAWYLWYSKYVAGAVITGLPAKPFLDNKNKK